MNRLSSLLILLLVFAFTNLTVSAFIGLRRPNKCRILPDIADRVCRMSSATEESSIPDKLMEEVWRYSKKPLISVGGKGATKKHGNSLRQLLDDHTVVKVKVNTKSFGTSRGVRC